VFTVAQGRVPAGPPEYVDRARELAEAIDENEDAVGRARLCARLGDLHLRYDRAGDAVLAYEGGVRLLLGRGHPVAGKRYGAGSSRVSPSLAVPMAPPDDEIDPDALLRRLLLGSAFAYLAQGQRAPAVSLIDAVVERGGGRDDPLRVPLLFARACVVLAAPGEVDLDDLHLIVEETGRHPMGEGTAARLAGLRAVAAHLGGDWESWPVMRRAVAAATDQPLAGLVWSTWAAGVAEQGAQLCGHAVERSREGCAFDHALALTAQGRLELACGRPDRAVEVLREALSIWGERVARLGTDTGRVGALEGSVAARDLLVEAELARGDLQRAVTAAEDARGAILEIETYRPGESLERPFVPRRLVYHVQAHRTVVFAVGEQDAHTGRTEVRLHLCPLGEEELQREVDEVIRALGVEGATRKCLPVPPLDVDDRDGTGERLSPLRRLYELLVEPLLDFFGPGGAPIVIEPDGPLWALPFAALGPADGDPLGIRFPLVTVASAGVASRLRARPVSPHSTVLAVADPVMPEIDGLVLNPLPGTREEVAWLDVHLPDCRPLTGGDATTDRVLDGMRTAAVIHIGTHGMARPDAPAEGFLALAPTDGDDGLLDAYRLTRGPGWSESGMMVQAAGGVPADAEWLDADLVTLSACQTAGGRQTSEGVIGLARTFLAIGARTVVASLWSVDDSVTAELMKAFYSRWCGGADPAVAMRDVARSVRDGGHADPRYWAPFLVLGAGIRGQVRDGSEMRSGQMVCRAR